MATAVACPSPPTPAAAGQAALHRTFTIASSSAGGRSRNIPLARGLPLSCRATASCSKPCPSSSPSSSSSSSSSAFNGSHSSVLPFRNRGPLGWAWREGLRQELDGVRTHHRAADNGMSERRAVIGNERETGNVAEAIAEAKGAIEADINQARSRALPAIAASEPYNEDGAASVANDRSNPDPDPDELSGPVELTYDPFATPPSTPIRTAASVVLSVAIAALLLRSLQRRSRKMKKTKFRSGGEEPISTKLKNTDGGDALRTTAVSEETSENASKKPSAFATLGGSLVAGAIALVLYKFATTVEGGLSKQPVSIDYTVRNLTITVRTIINGICYLATFVFAANSIGLGLYSIQLFLELIFPSDDSQAVSARDEKKEDDDDDLLPKDQVGEKDGGAGDGDGDVK